MSANATPSAEDEIYACLDLATPKSFFLFAGAGSGKTRSLVNALGKFKVDHPTLFRNSKKRIAIITFTNAACDEINRRINFDPLFRVSTTHSFAWELISPYQENIRAWLEKTLSKELEDVLAEHAATKPTLKKYVQQEIDIERLSNRLSALSSVKAFTYNPNGENVGKDALHHQEVIRIAASFITEFPLMRRMVVQFFPVLLIDESQDTNRQLMEAFFFLQQEMRSCFSLGLFGDTMQRIYEDGKKDLGVSLPLDWVCPTKTVNHRCPRRVITLINHIRSSMDKHMQVPSEANEEGVVRIFTCDANSAVNKVAFEDLVRLRMGELTGDAEWSDESKVKILTLEHRMAAKRGGFDNFFIPLHEVESFRMGLLDGSLSGVLFFAKQVIPLVSAIRENEKFAIAHLIRDYSPLFAKTRFQGSDAGLKVVQEANRAVQEFGKIAKQSNVMLLTLLQEIRKNKLLTIPDQLLPVGIEGNGFEEAEPEKQGGDKYTAWEKALSCTVKQFQDYLNYVEGSSRFDTHQGVKGLEFPRVMVILDDEARGFLFNYEKLLGVDPPTKSDLENEAQGNDSTIRRTARLMYVTCSRAEKSLAIVSYTKSPALAVEAMVKRGWFDMEEVDTETSKQVE